MTIKVVAQKASKDAFKGCFYAGRCERVRRSTPKFKARAAVSWLLSSGGNPVLRRAAGNALKELLEAVPRNQEGL